MTSSNIKTTWDCGNYDLFQHQNHIGLWEFRKGSPVGRTENCSSLVDLITSEIILDQKSNEDPVTKGIAMQNASVPHAIKSEKGKKYCEFC